jgi:hypothetical protein
MDGSYTLSYDINSVSSFKLSRSTISVWWMVATH